MKRSRSQSEFGGRSGLVQSLADGHTPTSREELWSLYATDPTDSSSVPDVENIGRMPEDLPDTWASEDGTPGKATI